MKPPGAPQILGLTKRGVTVETRVTVVRVTDVTVPVTTVVTTTDVERAVAVAKVVVEAVDRVMV